MIQIDLDIFKNIRRIIHYWTDSLHDVPTRYWLQINTNIFVLSFVAITITLWNSFMKWQKGKIRFLEICHAQEYKWVVTIQGQVTTLLSISCNVTFFTDCLGKCLTKIYYKVYSNILSYNPWFQINLRYKYIF